jgi:hypothetical protein
MLSVLGSARVHDLNPEQVADVDVVQRFLLVRIPELVRAEEAPVRPA